MGELFNAIRYVNLCQDFHIVVFCEWAMYPQYAAQLNSSFTDRVKHYGPLILLKKVMPRGTDLGNAVEVALYARIGSASTNLAEKKDGNNVFGSLSEAVGFIKDHNGQVLNPAQKPIGGIEQLLKVYSVPGDTVMDLFAGTGQVARAASKLGRNSISVEKDALQVGFLLNALQLASTAGTPTVAEYGACPKCGKLIGGEENVIACAKCGKRTHANCAIQSDSDTTMFCSQICQSSQLS